MQRREPSPGEVKLALERELATIEAKISRGGNYGRYTKGRRRLFQRRNLLRALLGDAPEEF